MAQHSWSIERQAMFEAFEKLKLPTPAWGAADNFHQQEMVVAYTDTLAHCGEGKELGKAWDFPPDMLVSRYEAEQPGVSYRYFNICGISAWFKHYSTEDWRSNCGDGDLEEMPQFNCVQEIDDQLRHAFWNPVYAIDFVAARGRDELVLKAIDFNPAPKLAGTPIAQEMKRLLGGSGGIVKAISARLDQLSGDKDYDNNQIHLK
jgi:hypothetical protein